MSRNARRALFASANFVFVGLLALSFFWPQTTHNRKTNWVGAPGPSQPIEFNHHVHVDELHIPCTYCHWTAATSRVANFPSADVCWGCHKNISITHPQIKILRAFYLANEPIPWVRINEEPGYVHFVHSSHIAAGVACTTCHGNVGAMYTVYQPIEMNMGWCLTCHRKLETKFHPKQKAVDCYTCHY